jgi:hypothetical protein
MVDVSCFFVFLSVELTVGFQETFENVQKGQ